MKGARRPPPSSVSDVLRKIVERYGITQDQLAEALGVSRYSVNQLLNDRRGVTAEMALRLAKATGTTPRFWLNIQQQVDLFRARRRLGSVLDKVKVVRKPLEDGELFYEVK